MSYRRLFVPLCLWAALLLPVPTAAQKKSIQTDKLISQSDIIVVGKVKERQSEWTSDKSRIQTRVTIDVNELLKGDARLDELEVYVLGGEVGGVGELYSHAVQFIDDEEVVVFAKRDKKNVFSVTDGERGKFTVKRDKVRDGEIPNIGSLRSFAADIKQKVQLQSGK